MIQAEQFLDNLAIAFAGYSQFGPETIAKAIAGHIRNGGLCYTQEWASDFIEKIASIEADRWELTHPEYEDEVERLKYWLGRQPDLD